MIDVLVGNNISVQWSIKNISGDAADLSDSEIVFAVRSKKKGAFKVTPSSVISGVIQAMIPGNLLPVGEYYLDVEWSKIISGRRIYWRARTVELINVTNNSKFKETVLVSYESAIITQGYVPDLSEFLNKNELAQEKGSSKTNAMSQDAVTKELDNIEGKTVYTTSLDITSITNGSSITESQQTELDNIFATSHPVYVPDKGFYGKSTVDTWTKKLILWYNDTLYSASAGSLNWTITKKSFYSKEETYSKKEIDARTEVIETVDDVLI